MTESNFNRATEIKREVGVIDQVTKLFGLDDELYINNPDKFREVVIDNRDRIADDILAIIGADLKAHYVNLKQELEKEFSEL